MLETASSSSYSRWITPSLKDQPQTWRREARRPREPKRASDVTLLCPEAVVASSDTLGWQNIRVIHLRHGLNEVVVPPSDSHCLILNLGTSVFLNAHFDKREFEGAIRAGE